ncbi:hypothetical protein ACTHGU_01420 [Chitinophagaceae bacterium MMS25-I14]
MSHLHYPEVTEYRLPKKNILVISCIDLRLTDELLHFLHFDNLTNRYDHFALAGTSVTMGATRPEHRSLFDEEMLNSFRSFEHWKDCLYEHIAIAIRLHKIEDVYIIEHEDCGAYSTFLKDGSFDTIEEEVECHKKFAVALSGEIRQKHDLHVHCFMIDIRGNVQLLDTSNSH